MKAGEDELNRNFWTTFMLLCQLSEFYSILSDGLPYGATKQISQVKDFAEEVYKEGILAGWVTKAEKIDECKKIKQQIQKIHPWIERGTKSMLDATAIVFAHGVLDASVYGYLEVLSLASPESFKIYVGKKQVDLSEIKAKSYDQLLKDKIKKFMQETVENNSLIYKLDKLHEIAKPTDTQINPEHKYDRERLVKFDKARHDIVHGNNWRNYSIDFQQEFSYWSSLNAYFYNLVMQKTGLKLSQAGWGKYMFER